MMSAQTFNRLGAQTFTRLGLEYPTHPTQRTPPRRKKEKSGGKEQRARNSKMEDNLHHILPEELTATITVAEYDWENLIKITKNFNSSHLVGNNLYKDVSSSLAVRVLTDSKFQENPKKYLLDLASIAKLQNQHYSGLVGFCIHREARVLALIYKFASKGSLKDLLHRKEVSWSSRLRIGREVAMALHYLHSQGCSHGSVKSSNVLVFDNDVAKLAEVLPLLSDREEGRLQIEKDMVDYGCLLWEIMTGVVLQEDRPDVPMLGLESVDSYVDHSLDEYRTSQALELSFIIKTCLVQKPQPPDISRFTRLQFSSPEELAYLLKVPGPTYLDKVLHLKTLSQEQIASLVESSLPPLVQHEEARFHSMEEVIERFNIMGA